MVHVYYWNDSDKLRKGRENTSTCLQCVWQRAKLTCKWLFRGICLNPHKQCSQLCPSQVRSENVSFSWLAATDISCRLNLSNYISNSRDHAWLVQPWTVTKELLLVVRSWLIFFLISFLTFIFRWIQFRFRGVFTVSSWLSLLHRTQQLAMYRLPSTQVHFLTILWSFKSWK